MKILVINWQDITNPQGGGAEVHFHEIFKRIVAMGHQVTLFCCKYNGVKNQDIIDGIKIIRAGSRGIFNYIVPFYYLNKFRKENYDIIIDDINKIPFYTPLFVKRPLLAISHHFFGKSIFIESNFLIGLYVYFAEKLVDFVYKKTPFVVVSKSTLDEFIERGFNKNYFSIVQNAIEPKNYPLQLSEKYSVPTITYFGRIKKYKSVHHIIQAFPRVLQSIPNAELHILGRGDYQPQLEKLSEDLNIKSHVKFFGYITDEQKIKYLSSAHCVINSSPKEGWGITNIEANACGTPVISADSPGLCDSINNNVSGLLYEYGNINQLSEKIISVLSDKKLLNKLSTGAIEWAKTFTWDNSANLMINRISEVINNYK